jgi:hypothetical protein
MIWARGMGKIMYVTASAHPGRGLQCAFCAGRKKHPRDVAIDATGARSRHQPDLISSCSSPTSACIWARNGACAHANVGTSCLMLASSSPRTPSP